MLALTITGCFNDGDKEENKVKIAVIGDSISDGCNPELSTSAEMYAKRYGYAQMLEGKKYEEIDTPAKTIYNIWNNAEYRNFSITGSKASEWNMDSSTSTKWHTWDKEFQKVLDFNPDIAVIYLGANDIFEYVYKDGVVTPDELSDLSTNLKGIVDKLKSKNDKIKIVIVGYYDLFDGYSLALSASTVDSFKIFKDMSAITVAGNKVLSDLATLEGAVYVDNYSTFMNHCYGIFLGNTNASPSLYVTNSINTFDIHPVTAGHKIIYQNVYSTLEKIK